MPFYSVTFNTLEYSLNPASLKAATRMVSELFFFNPEIVAVFVPAATVIVDHVFPPSSEYSSLKPVSFIEVSTQETLSDFELFATETSFKSAGAVGVVGATIIGSSRVVSEMAEVQADEPAMLAVCRR